MSLLETMKAVAAPWLVPLAAPFNAQERIWIVYGVTTLMIAYAVYRHGGGVRGRVGVFLAYCFPKEIYRHPSSKLDFIFFIVNKAAFVVFFAPLVLGSVTVAQAAAAGLETLLGPLSAPLPDVWWTVVPYTILIMLALDLGIFLGHYFQHRIPALWEFHKVHHSAEVLNPITVYRMHPVDDLLIGSLSALFAGGVHGLFAYATGGMVSDIKVHGLNIGFFVFYLLGYHLRHSHIWLSYPVWLSHLLMSPAQHQIHHSAEERHFDKNLGFIFSFWDWAAGTLYAPRQRETFPLGLAGGEHVEFDTLTKLYFLPFVKLGKKIGRMVTA